MNVTRDNELNNGTVMIPLNQNPNSSLPRNTNISQVPSYYNFSSHSTNLLALNHHLADGKCRSSDQFNELQPLGSSTSRWNPTQEQILALEEMYRGGTRTPSAEEIQHIALQLRRFGKIEGKNVFYWFQNHKARERQKRRRREMGANHSDQEKQHNPHHNISADKKESGLRKTSYGIEPTKNWAPSSSCSKHSEEFVSMHRAVAESISSCGPHYGWTQFDERELQQRKSCTGITTAATAAEVMNATWKKKEFPSLEYKKLLKTDHHQNLIGFSLLNMKPYQENFNRNIENRESQTLELFPLHDKDDGNSVKDNNKLPITAINDTTNFTPSTSQFIEFLPLKN